MKQSNIVVTSENKDNKPIHTEITVGMAHTLRGVGTHIIIRPDGKINPLDPDNDLAILIN
jgi:hypothetical protein